MRKLTQIRASKDSLIQLNSNENKSNVAFVCVYNCKFRQIGNLPDFNRKTSITGNRKGDRFQMLQIVSVAEIGC